jgi:hypothetical protein
VRVALAQSWLLFLLVHVAQFSHATPVITRQPQTIVDELGKVSGLSVEATGAGPLRYQWRYFDKYIGQPTAPIEGATSAIFTPPQAPLPMPVVVEITDATGSTLSESAAIDWVQQAALTELARWPSPLKGPAIASTIRGNLAYVSAGSLQVFDITNPSSPIRAGVAIDPFLQRSYENWQIPATAGVQVDDQIAVVSGNSVYDLSDPLTPQVLSLVQAGSSRFIMKDRYAYLCLGHSGVGILDLRNPRDLKIVSLLLGNDPPRSPFRLLDVALYGDILYVADADIEGLEQRSSLHVLDVSKKIEPKLVSRLGPAYAVAVQGNELYTVGNGLQVFDITEPTAPKLLGAASGQFDRSNVSRLTVSDGFAYLSYRTNGLWRYDVRNPLNPQAAGRLVNGGSAEDLQVLGNVGYLSNGELGWQVIDLSAFPDPVVIQSTDSSTTIADLVVKEDIVFAAAMSSGLEIVDFTDLSRPRKLTTVTTRDSAYSIATRDHLVYLASGTAGIEIIDVRAPTAPISVTTLAFAEESAQLVLESGTNLLVATDRFLYLFDISDPAIPTSKSRLLALEPKTQIALWEESAVINTWRSGPADVVYVLDLPSKQVRTAHISPRDPYGWTVQEIYAAIHPPLELCSPAQLRVRTFFGKANHLYGYRAFVSRDLLLGFGQSGTAQIYDLSTPAQFGLADNGPGVPGGGSFRQLIPIGDRIYAASGNAGIQVLKWDDGAPTIVQQPQAHSFYTSGMHYQYRDMESRGTRPLTFRWYEGNKGDTNRPLDSASGPSGSYAENTLPFRTNANLAITIWARVSNQLGSTDTESVTISFAPLLNVSKSGLNLSLRWTSFADGSWILENSLDLATWRSFEDANISSENGQFQADIPTPQATEAQFIRLRYVPPISESIPSSNPNHL